MINRKSLTVFRFIEGSGIKKTDNCQQELIKVRKNRLKQNRLIEGCEKIKSDFKSSYKDIECDYILMIY